MVNVNKSIKPAVPQQPIINRAARRARNQALNSSKKLPDSIKNRRMQKLNCSREEVINTLVNEEGIYTQEEAEELINEFENQTGAKVERLATMDEVDNLDGEFWATKDGETKLWCRGNGFWYECTENLDSGCHEESVNENLNSAASEAESGKVTLYNDFADITDDEVDKLVKDRVKEMAPSCEVSVRRDNDTELTVQLKGTDEEITRGRLAVESSDVTKSVAWESKLDSGCSGKKDMNSELNCSESEGETVMITTESGNEVAITDIKVVQDPNTNEIALYVPENGDDEIPEGFVIIGGVVSDTAEPEVEMPAADGEAEIPEEEDVDASKKKTELDSALGESDDSRDACSQVTVPKSFPDDKVIELKEFVEQALSEAGYMVTMYMVGRPSAAVIEFDYETNGVSPVEVDKLIETRTNDFIQNGYTGFGTAINDEPEVIDAQPAPEEDELDSSKQNMNCAIENARVEQTPQGTFVVIADSERFGKDAILYEHYSEEGANKYLDKLNRGGELAATGYTRSEVDTDSSKKEELNCSEGINAAKLTTEGITKAMNNSIREDPDTPIVMIPLEGNNVAFISPAGYEDNALVMQGKFPEAAMYVEIFHRDNSATRKKLLGSEVVDFIQNFMAEDQATE